MSISDIVYPIFTVNECLFEHCCISAESMTTVCILEADISDIGYRDTIGLRIITCCYMG